MADKPSPDAAAVEKPKSKKLLIIIIAVVVLVLIGGGAAFFLLKNKHANEDTGEEPAHAAAAPSHTAADSHNPPTYLPLDNMVVNLADAGGGRFAQVGLTLKLDDAKTAEAVKAFMPSIRNGILMQISQRTADELLGVEGKEKLTKAIIREISEQMGYEMEDEDAATTNQKKKKRSAPPNPVQAVLFSSFIVQ
jgi:flagellar FliL protein